MKVILDEDYTYKRIEFCCSQMGKALMLGDIKSQMHTDHYPIFKLERHLINNCPYCGAKITGIIEPR